MKILILSVGKERQRAVREAVEDYLQRARPTFICEWAEVRQSRARDAAEIIRAKEEEGERLLARVPSGYRSIALDEHGATTRSTELAELLQRARLDAGAGLAFLIGGAFGLSPQVLRTSERSLSLSALTLPHSLALLVLAEQLYRAKTIIRGEPYHKA